MFMGSQMAEPTQGQRNFLRCSMKKKAKAGPVEKKALNFVCSNANILRRHGEKQPEKISWKINSRETFFSARVVSELLKKRQH